MSNSNDPRETALKAYSGQGSPSKDRPQVKQVPQGMSPLDTATLGYKLAQRGAETKRRPAKSPLDSVANKLPLDYIGLVVAPPTREEARFFSPDMQKLMTELEQANKAIQAIPQMEQTIKNTNSEMDIALQERDIDTYNKLKLSLESKEASLSKIRGFVDTTLRAAKAYHENNPDAIAKSRDMLKTLRTQLSASYSYSEAKDNIPTHTKPVVQWLDDIKNKPSLEDRILAQKVLESAGIDHKAMLTEVARQGLSLTDKAIMEMRDKEAGTPSTTQVPKSQI